MTELKKFKRFIPFAKIDEAKREVYGLVTSEAKDSDGQRCDYKTTKPFYEKWSEGFSKATDGKSLGNVREMHDNIAAGKVTRLEFDDEGKRILAASKIVDDSSWKKVCEGVLTGYSHGGTYATDPWKDDGGDEWYTANPLEISIVDLPANPEAMFEHVKANGSVEIRKFADLKKSETKPEHKPISDKSAQIVSDFATRTMQKGMYEVSRFAELLQGLYWLALAAESEREWEGDDSDIPEELRGHIEGLCSTFEEMTVEEVKELVQTLTATGGAKELYMSEKIADLAKAAHSLAAHFKKAASHHEKMAKAHEAHAEHLHKMAEACSADEGKAKAAQAEIQKSAEQIETEKAAEIEKQAAGTADAELEKKVDERMKPLEDHLKKLNDTLQTILNTPEDAKVAKTAVAVTKEEDGKADLEKKDDTPKVITAPSDMASLLKGIKPVENAVIPSR